MSNIPTINTTPKFGGPDLDLTARLVAPVSPTGHGTSHAAAEARRRTSDWTPSQRVVQRNLSFDREEHKRQMMAASGALQKD